MTLSDRLISALENLADKKAGNEVGWINIADARALTDLGLAERTQDGWDITKAGESALAAQRAGEGDRPSADPRQ
jgi:hypothetical protein